MPKLSTAQLEARRLELLRAALRCFARNGVVPTTMRQIAKEAGAAVGTFYLYFDSKKDMLEALIELNQRRTNAFLEELTHRHRKAPAGAVEELFEQSLAAMAEPAGRQAGELDLQLYAIATVDPQLERWISDLLDLWQTAMLRWLEAATRRGQISPANGPAATARTLLALLQGSLLVEVLQGYDRQRNLRSRRDARSAVLQLLGV